VLNLHGGGLPMRYQKTTMLTNWLFKNAIAITAPSLYLQNYFNQNGYNVVLIPNPINLSNYPIVNNSIDYPIILYLRGFGKIYRPLLVLESLTLIKSEYPKVVLHMFGTTNIGMYAICKNYIIENDLESNVVIHGSKSTDIWVQIAKECNMSISIPEFDNTPVSVIECMAMQIPVISADVGGIPFLIKDRVNGLITKPLAVEIAKNVRELVNNKELYRDIQNNAFSNINTYSIDEVVSKWKIVLNSILHN
jgi:glycosyltransferase involved in cell wall biosynthesis